MKDILSPPSTFPERIFRARTFPNVMCFSGADPALAGPIGNFARTIVARAVKLFRPFDYGEAARLFFRRRIGRKPTARARVCSRRRTLDYVVTPRRGAILFMKKDPANGHVPSTRLLSPLLHPSVVSSARRENRPGAGLVITKLF